MNKKPFYNATIAAGYIALVISIMNWLTGLPEPTKGNLFVPMGMLSLFVLSAAIMGFLFFYEPALLLIEHKRAEAVAFFFKTVAAFACFGLIFGAIAIALL